MQNGWKIKSIPFLQSGQTAPSADTTSPQPRQRGGRIASTACRATDFTAALIDISETIADQSPDTLFRAGKAAYVPHMTDESVLFDRTAVRRHRDRAAATFGDHDFLHREISDRLTDRLQDVNRTFDTVLDLGGGHGNTTVSPSPRTLVTCDMSDDLLRTSLPSCAVAMDEEYLPFADNTVDLAISSLALHWVNDLPGALTQICRALKPDGLFLAAILGGDTLIELRRALLEAEAETTGGTSPHTSPVADVADAGALLQRAGFALPVVDTDTLTVTYKDMFALMRDLRGMGETNAVAARNKTFLRRDTLFVAAARYQELYGDADGRIPATFQIIWLTGWAPAATQQQPLRPGSAGSRLADALGADEQAAGDMAGPVSN